MNLHAVAAARPSQYSAPAATPSTALVLTPALRLKAARGRLARLPADAGRQARLEAVAAAWAALTAVYPVLAGDRPLAIGILEEIRGVVPELSGMALRRILARQVGRSVYLTACAAPGAQRWHLDGSPADVVSDRHQSHAMKRLGLTP